ncbi:hypothetical protein [Cupriavidus sp. L7L]|uniref:hypothetical protein n=1 Tax=Cupriavidus sp. L7L TaxID=2546443 RepID=UPI0010566ADF|nr:hypothetical protein [Cupriavidus sp. L7L]TDF63155.1 hypothetical protein E1J61_25700 [Cupriavidus sp. L7L]
MATINHFGPYYVTPAGGLAPGAACNVVWGPSDVFKGSTINVTAHPGGNRRARYAAWISDMSIENVISGTGDISFVETNAYATFANDGQETIDYVSLYLTVTTA